MSVTEALNAQVMALLTPVLNRVEQLESLVAELAAQSRCEPRPQFARKQVEEIQADLSSLCARLDELLG